MVSSTTSPIYIAPKTAITVFSLNTYSIKHIVLSIRHPHQSVPREHLTIYIYAYHTLIITARQFSVTFR